MTKQAVIAIVVGILILVGAVGAFLYSQSRPSSDTANTTTASQVSETPEEGAIQSTITEILAGGREAKCTFTAGDENGQTSGTVYTSGQNARGDFTTTVNGDETMTHMIKDGETFYMWGDSLATGVKMVMNINELSENLENNDQFQSFNPDQEMDIDCVSWTRDATLFSPPTNIRFISIDAMGPTGTTTQTTGAPTGAAQSGNSNQCNICTSLTGQARTACLAQFNCN
jgi:hypothetical protein